MLEVFVIIICIAFIMWVAQRLIQERRLKKGLSKQCPHCFNEIDGRATACEHCHQKI